MRRAWDARLAALEGRVSREAARSHALEYPFDCTNVDEWLEEHAPPWPFIAVPEKAPDAETWTRWVREWYGRSCEDAPCNTVADS